MGIEFTLSDLEVSFFIIGCEEVGGTSPEFLFTKQPLCYVPLCRWCSGLQTEADGSYWRNLYHPHLSAFGPGAQTKQVSRK